MAASDWVTCGDELCGEESWVLEVVGLRAGASHFTDCVKTSLAIYAKKMA